MKLSKLSKYVIFSIIAMLIFSAVVIIAAITKGVTLDTLTTCFFAVFGGEVFSCAFS
mgnify:CR=1 FL=1